MSNDTESATPRATLLAIAGIEVGGACLLVKGPPGLPYPMRVTVEHAGVSGVTMRDGSRHHCATVRTGGGYRTAVRIVGCLAPTPDNTMFSSTDCPKCSTQPDYQDRKDVTTLPAGELFCMACEARWSVDCCADWRNLDMPSRVDLLARAGLDADHARDNHWPTCGDGRD